MDRSYIFDCFTWFDILRIRPYRAGSPAARLGYCIYCTTR